MSTPSAMTGLALHIQELGPVAHLVTVGSEASPHVVAVRVGWEGRELVVTAGRRTSANVEQHPGVTLLWAAAPGSSYSLIIDGTARPQPGATGPSLAIKPTGAVLHRSPDGDPAAPTCITVLPKT